MSFSMGNAMAIFRSMVYNIFHDLLDNGVIVYLDDILIYTKEVYKHVPLVQEVLSQVNTLAMELHLGAVPGLTH